MKLYSADNQKSPPPGTVRIIHTLPVQQRQSLLIPTPLFGVDPFKQLSYNTILWGSIRASFCARMRRTKYLSNSSRYQQNRFGWRRTDSGPGIGIWWWWSSSSSSSWSWMVLQLNPFCVLFWIMYLCLSSVSVCSATRAYRKKKVEAVMKCKIA